MRNLYAKKSIFTSITQGSIINNCLANEYKGAEVYGIIVTPRCDMDHGIKVSTVHYLPVVGFNDWVKVDFLKILQDRLKKDICGKINQWINDNYDIKDFLNTSLATQENILDLLVDPVPPDKVMNYIKQYYDEDGAFNEALKEARKLKKQILKELHSGDLHNFYLLEHWIPDETERHLVVILREIHQISRDIMHKYLGGFLSSEFEEEKLKLNSLVINDSEYKLQAEISSPFVEHLLQSFIYNFSRIGVEDMDRPNWDSLI